MAEGVNAGRKNSQVSRAAGTFPGKEEEGKRGKREKEEEGARKKDERQQRNIYMYKNTGTINSIHGY